jgi:serine/threonine protein kinase
MPACCCCGCCCCSSSSSPSVKIADFGSAKMLHSRRSCYVHQEQETQGYEPVGPAENQDSECSASRMRGTPLWMAPEVLQGVEQGFPSDIWSLGCTVVEMLEGSSPWILAGHKTSSLESLLFRIACSEENPPLPRAVSEECRDFLSRCLHRDPKQRWTASQLLHHPFLANLHCCIHGDGPALHYHEPICSELRIPQTQSPRSTLSGLLDLSDGESDCEQDEIGSAIPLTYTPLNLGRRTEICCDSPHAEIPRDCNWITVRGSAKRDSVEKHAEAGLNQDFTEADSRHGCMVKKGAEVNLACFDFLLRRRKNV